MADTGLVVASNRGPVSWTRQDGELVPERGAGGLVSALGGALRDGAGVWISVALDDADRELAAHHADGPFDVKLEDGTYRLRLLDVGDDFDAYYNRVSNRLLWFTVHQLWAAPYEPSGVDWRRDWYQGYERVNERVARAVVDQAAAAGEVYLQDYHLCVAPRLVRAAAPDVAILHYLHTPWVGPDSLRMLPTPITERLLSSLLAADVVAFSSHAWARDFRHCAAEMLGAEIMGETVVFEDRETEVTNFVLGVDEEQLRQAAATEDAISAGGRIEDQRAGRQLVLRVDRTDLSKNILRGLLAYERLLTTHPEHRDRVWHLALLNPSRQDVPEYAEYLEACRGAAERIRQRFGEDCLELAIGSDYPRVLAAMQRYDVLLANPVIDGTNLVAKEGAVLNANNGVLVLSHHTGATEVLGEAAVLVNPYDVEEQADALHAALTMDPEERAWRSHALREAATRGAPERWLSAQQHRLRAAVGNG